MTLWTLERLPLPGLASSRESKGLSTPESIPFICKLTTPEPTFPHLNGLLLPALSNSGPGTRRLGQAWCFPWVAWSWGGVECPLLLRTVSKEPSFRWQSTPDLLASYLNNNKIYILKQYLSKKKKNISFGNKTWVQIHGLYLHSVLPRNLLDFSEPHLLQL